MAHEVVCWSEEVNATRAKRHAARDVRGESYLRSLREVMIASRTTFTNLLAAHGFETFRPPQSPGIGDFTRVGPSMQALQVAIARSRPSLQHDLAVLPKGWMRVSGTSVVLPRGPAGPQGAEAVRGLSLIHI